jgi:phosphomevalonate kinase
MSLKFSDKASYAKHLGAQAEAAHAAAQALQGASAGAFIEALANQHRALDLLGAAAGAELVVDAVRQLHRTAQKQGAAVLPAGAGGGDISVYVGLEPPSKALILLAGRLGQKPLDLELGAPGLMRLPSRQITS